MYVMRKTDMCVCLCAPTKKNVLLWQKDCLIMRIKAGRIVISYHLSPLGIIQLCVTNIIATYQKKIASKVSFNNKYEEMIKKNC